MRSFRLLRTFLGDVIKIESCLVLMVVGAVAVAGGVIAVGMLAILA